MKNMPFLIAIAGGALVFFLWNQRRAQAAQPAITAQPLAPSSVPQEWIEMTPEGYGVIGTTGDPWDILT